MKHNPTHSDNPSNEALHNDSREQQVKRSPDLQASAKTVADEQPRLNSRKDLHRMAEKYQVDVKPKEKLSRRRIIICIVISLICYTYLIVGHNLAVRNMPHFAQAMNGVETARVLEIRSVKETASPFTYSDGKRKGDTQYRVIFAAEVLTGGSKGEIVRAQQIAVTRAKEAPLLVRPGDKVYLSDPAKLWGSAKQREAAPSMPASGSANGQPATGMQASPQQQPAPAAPNSGKEPGLSRIAPDEPQSDDIWVMYQFVRIGPIYLLGALLLGLMILLGRWKGIGTMVSLIYTVGSVFLVFIPAVLAGANVYLLTAWTLFSIVLLTVSLLNGMNVKSLTAALGCFGGMLFASLLIWIMHHALHLTGIVDENTGYLLLLNQNKTIDLAAVSFATILIGACGALLDVGVDLAASLWEYSQTSEGQKPSAIFRTGMHIGRDIMGTMVNTIILAYAGGSLSGLLMTAALNSGTIAYLLNSEGIIIEMLQMLIGSLGVIVCIPATSLIAGILYTRHNHKLKMRADERAAETPLAV